MSCEGDALAAIFHPASSPVKGAVLPIVGGRQTRVGAHRQYRNLACSLAKAGFAVLRFDSRGKGDSSGEFQDFDQIGPDIAVAAKTLGDKAAVEGICVWGLCDGASAALLHASGLAEVSRLILVNPWVWDEGSEDGTIIRHYYSAHILSRAFWKRLFAGEVKMFAAVRELLHRVIWASKSSTEPASITTYQGQMISNLLNFKGKTLIILSERDLVARNFEDFLKKEPAWQKALASGDVTIERIDKADHTFSEPEAERIMIEKTTEWLTTDHQA